MMNKYVVVVISLLFSTLSSQGMFKHKKSTDHTAEQDHKIPITKLDDGIKKLREDQLHYRSKHKVFKDEPNDVRLNTVEKK